MGRVSCCAVALFLVLCLTDIVAARHIEEGSTDFAGRSLLQKKKLSKEEKLLAEEREREREAEALADFREFQASRNAEKERLIVAAIDEADALDFKLIKLGKNGKKKELTNLWKNGKGLVISQLLQFAIKDGKEKDLNKVVLKSMEKAEKQGFGIKVAEAVAAALTVVLEDGEADPFVNILKMRMNALNKKTKGSGCEYIKFMFLDAEAFAAADSREIDLTLAIDSKQHVEIAECFLEECKGNAAECCVSDKAKNSGLCNCGKGKNARVCEFNLFWSQPRPIWKCSSPDCEEEKCLCPTGKALAKLKKSFKAGKKKSKKGGKDKKKKKKNSKKGGDNKKNKDKKNAKKNNGKKSKKNSNKKTEKERSKKNNKKDVKKGKKSNKSS